MIEGILKRFKYVRDLKAEIDRLQSSIQSVASNLIKEALALNKIIDYQKSHRDILLDIIANQKDEIKKLQDENETLRKG